MSRILNLKSIKAGPFVVKLLILVFLGCFLSCSPKQESQLLVGKWKYSGVKETVVIEFNENNTFSGLIFDLKREWKFSGEWRLQKNVIKYSYNESDYTAATGRVVDEDIILKITPYSLLLKNLNSGELYPCVKY